MAITVGYRKFFVCDTCGDNKEMTKKEVMRHVKIFHKEESLEGKRELFMHINKRPRHITIYTWNFKGGTKIIETNR